MDFALRSRDEKIAALQAEVDTLRIQADKTQRRLNAARATSHSQTHASQIQDRKIEQLRRKLHDVRAAHFIERSAAAQELAEARRSC
ncbi:hypothetical protein BV25DRAFT_1823548, partial [Artomyces pyxidatus]